MHANPLEIPLPNNEPVLHYAPGSGERRHLRSTLKALRGETVEIPARIGGRDVRTGNTVEIRAPHDHRTVLAVAHLCGPAEVAEAIGCALEARRDWMRTPWPERLGIFRKAADLLSGPWRDTLNAATMLGQSKNVFQAEIDAACETIDFWRFNAAYAERIVADQPLSSEGVRNRMEYRALEGFVAAITPFNFTAIQANLATAPVLMGNVALWKPSTTALLSAWHTYRLLEEAGLPPGVINLLPGEGPEAGAPMLASEHLAGLHFTGSTKTFQHMWRTMGERIDAYRTYPRIVGETGGKDFVIAHPSAPPLEVAAAIVRGGFEYQGQKCSAASRVYLPASRWPAIRQALTEQLDEVKTGPVENFANFVNAVIDRAAFRRITGYIDRALADPDTELVHGGTYSDEEGYFIAPSVFRVRDPLHETMREELFGPVVSVFTYEDARYEDMLDLLDKTSPYALTGAVFATDREVIRKTLDRLLDNAGNVYINDKPTGAVVGQQPFGGARKSGTNDKAGSILNLTRWTSARTIKETLAPPTHFAYPFLG